MLDLIDKIPAEGDSIEIHHDKRTLTFTAKAMDALRIDKIGVEFKLDSEEEPTE